MTAFSAPRERVRGPARPRMRSGTDAELRKRFPPRDVPDGWEATCQVRDTVMSRLLRAPFTDGTTAANVRRRRLGLGRFLDWLAQYPGDTWQQRWIASGVARDGTLDWRPQAAGWLASTGRASLQTAGLETSITSGLGQLIYADVLRPSAEWLLSSPIRFPLGGEMPRVRDPAGFAALEERAAAAGIGFFSRRRAVEQVAIIVAAKGGTVADITVGDCLEFMEIRDRLAGTMDGGKGAGFYQLLHSAGIFPPGAPATLRMFDPRFQGQLTDAELIDQYAITCQPVRDLLVDYLREHRPSLDYSSLKGLAFLLGKLFWKDLETHNPGISSLRLEPDTAAAWKMRLAVKTVPAGDGGTAAAVRMDTLSCLSAVRAFYLDIAQWALDDPARWGPWAAPCPVRRDDVSTAKHYARRKSRMDQRTRERLPVLPALAAAAARNREAAAALLAAADGAEPGSLFTSGTVTLLRHVTKTPASRTWAEDPDGGRRRDLTLEEEAAFWAWAAIEILRATGIRIEELTELSHHSLVQYRTPATGELVPLLHIAPSKTDVERLLVISPEVADVLAAVIRRVRDDTGAVPLVIAYDVHECRFTPPMPVLFQRRVGADSRPVSAGVIRRWINAALDSTGLTDASGRPLRFTPHDFRRIFATDAIMNGLPPHICQLLMGHKNINTTMGYKAVYPEEAITSHRAFIGRRRKLRPAEEYRVPTIEEWDEFLGHFERRKLALGDCGRSWGTSCIHEHSCIRCPLLRIDPAQKPRLEAIRDNLTARITEAGQQGWAGEAEGLKVSLAAANNKLAQIELTAARRTRAVSLGTPAYRDTAASVITAAHGPDASEGTPCPPPTGRRRSAPAPAVSTPPKPPPGCSLPTPPGWTATTSASSSTPTPEPGWPPSTGQP
jgi:integrase